MTDLITRVADMLAQDTIQALRDYDVSEELPRNDPEFSDAVIATARAVVALVRADLPPKLAEVEAALTAARAALVTARREMQLEAAKVAVDYGKVQYSANIERHPQYANDAADDALEIADAIRALPTMEEKTDE